MFNTARHQWQSGFTLVELLISMLLGLMVVGMMMLPAASARFWMASAAGQISLAVGMGAVASWAGLLVSYHFNVPASPAIILCAGLAYLLSVAIGPHGGLLHTLRRRRLPVARGW